MKAKKRAVLALAICVAALSVLLGLLLYQPEADSSAETIPTVYEVVNIPLSELTAVKVENTNAAYAVLNSADGVEMVSKVSQVYDEAQLRAFLYAAGHISGSRKVTDPATFKGYGVEDPRATVTLYQRDANQLQYQVLADNPMDQSTYLYAIAEQAIYLIPREIAALFLRTEQDFVSRMIFTLRTQEDFDTISQISIKYNDAGRDYTVEQTDQGFYLTSPVHLRLSSTNVNNVLLNPLLQLYADEVVATQADLSQYGLDAPELEITLTMDGQTKRAVLVRTADDQCLLAEAQGTVVYRLDDAPMLLLMQDYTALLGSGIASYTAGELSDLTLTNGEQSLFVTFSGSGTALVAQLNGITLPQALQNQLLQALNQLTPIAEMSATPNAVPLYQWTANLRKGTQETVALSPVAEELYAVSINGVADFVTDAGAVQRIQALWDALIALT